MVAVADSVLPELILPHGTVRPFVSIFGNEIITAPGTTTRQLRADREAQYARQLSVIRIRLRNHYPKHHESNRMPQLDVNTGESPLALEGESAQNRGHRHRRPSLASLSLRLQTLGIQTC